MGSSSHGDRSASYAGAVPDDGPRGNADAGFATNAFAFGVGLSADLGVTFADRYAIAVRLTGTFSLLVAAGIGYAWW